MSKKVVFILLFFCCISFSQNEANNWYFGENAGLDFSNSNPIPLLDGELNSAEGCASISDVSGNLLFYTDGVTVWNKQHQVMQNGNGLSGDTSSFQSSIVIPKPQNPDIYYIFTIDNDNGENGLRYSEVNLNLNGGLGAITNKNILLYATVPEFIAATKSSTSNEYWVVGHKWNSNEFIVYNISEDGVNQTPVISSVGSFIQLTGFQGSIKISPDGTKLVMGSVHVTLEVFDFNASTGVISSPITLDNSEIHSGLAFSPNSQILYSVQNSNIYQYNLQAGSTEQIINSKRKLNVNQESCISNNECIFGAQLAPNGKIYFAKRDSAYLSVIEKPNNLEFPDFRDNYIYLDGVNSREGLPNFVSTFLLDGIAFENACFGSETQFSLTNNRTFDSILWDFGDPASGVNNTSTDASPLHVFSAPGIYLVSVVISEGTQQLVIEKTVVIFDKPIAHQAEDLDVCVGDFVNLNNQNSAILNGQSVDGITLTYHLNQTDASNGNNPINAGFNVTDNQIIYARLEVTGFPYCYDVSTFVINVIDGQDILFMADIWYICEDEDVELVADSGYDNYIWSTGEMSQSIIVGSPGSYTITVSNNNGPSCGISKTVSVVASSEANIIEIELIDFTIDANSIIIQVTGNGDYEYSIDGITYQDSNVFSDLVVDEYNVYVRDKLGCGTVTETVFLLGAPKYFTPNGDGNHDRWQIINGFTEPSNVIQIFDRFGKLLKQLSPTNIGWDGTFNGNLLPNSDYWFVVERQNGRTYTGHFTLKR